MITPLPLKLYKIKALSTVTHVPLGLSNAVPAFDKSFEPEAASTSSLNPTKLIATHSKAIHSSSTLSHRSQWEEALEDRRVEQAVCMLTRSICSNIRLMPFLLIKVERFNQLGSRQTRENTFQPHHPLHRPVAPNSMTLSALLAAGAHLGHSKSLLRPAFLPYAYGTRAGITIIDLDRTLPLLRRAANITRAVARNNGSILFVGTNDALQPAVSKAARRMGRNAYQLSTRWKPGTLTNAQQLFGADIVGEQNYIPDLVILLNPLDNMVLIRECCAKHIPTIALIDSNVDPRIVTYPIPANDDSVRTAELIVGMLSMAGKEGLRELDELSGPPKEIHYDAIQPPSLSSHMSASP